MSTVDSSVAPRAVAPTRDPGAGEPAPRLSVRDLRVAFATSAGVREVVRGVSFDLAPGRCVAIVGESGSGKSVTARTLVGLTGQGAHVRAERLDLHGRDVRGLSPRAWRELRGREVGFVLQDALVSLDPLRPVGREIAEPLRLHRWGDRAARARRVVELLTRVGVPSPEVRARQRPGELSGGLRQRALIASAVALDPDVVIADEPTTALDVTVQAQVLTQLELMLTRGASVLLISHDLAVVARLADHILVMQDGDVVEQGPRSQVLGAPQHPYTRRLVAAVPSSTTRGRALSPAGPVDVRDDRARTDVPPSDGPVLEARGLVKRFGTPGGGTLTAVDGVSFTVERGRTLGIVGESGSGKSTAARLALALTDLDAGEVRLLGRPWSNLTERRRRDLRRHVTVVPQDPLSSFDPRWNVERILLEAVDHERHPTARARRERVELLLHQVGLGPEVLPRFPLRMSGGQRQRVAIARALAPAPSLVVLDEAVSALDVTIQAQVLDLLVALQRELGVSYLFISHDLGVIGHLSDHVLVMKDGRVVEEGDPDVLFARPQHPYTRELIASIPRLEPAAPPTRV